jgi:hypothetical protein
MENKYPLYSPIQYGRRVVAYGMWDANKYPFMASTCQSFVVNMMLAREPKTQIAGITMLGDMTNMTRKHWPGNWTEVKLYSSFMRVGINTYLIQLLRFCKGYVCQF